MSVRLGPAPLSAAAAFRALDRPGLGGVVIFVGRVRPDRGSAGRVVALRYEAHRPLALRALRELERAARSKAPGARVVLWHRLGILPVGTASVIVGSATAHRAEAFALSRWLIERLKREVPIWKTDRVRPGRRRRARRAPRGGR